MAGSQTEIVTKPGRWTPASLCRSHRLNELLQLIVRRGPAVEAFDRVEQVALEQLGVEPRERVRPRDVIEAEVVRAEREEGATLARHGRERAAELAELVLVHAEDVRLCGATSSSSATAAELAARLAPARQRPHRPLLPKQ